jgi:hypothetical protein
MHKRLDWDVIERRNRIQISLDTYNAYLRYRQAEEANGPACSLASSGRLTVAEVAGKQVSFTLKAMRER